MRESLKKMKLYIEWIMMHLIISLNSKKINKKYMNELWKMICTILWFKFNWKSLNDYEVLCFKDKIWNILYRADEKWITENMKFYKTNIIINENSNYCQEKYN